MHQDVDLRVRLVGPGRLGRSVFALLSARGLPVELWGRSGRIEGDCPDPNLTYLLVPDRALGAAALAHADAQVLLHASGATDLEVLGPHPAAASLHPLMSFPGPEVSLPTGLVPAAVAGEGQAAEVAGALATALGWTPFPMNGDRRLYHAAAVVAGNFSAALLYAGGALLAEAGVPEAEARGLLLPLVRAGLDNAARSPAGQALTGPVARGDEAVLRAHQNAIADAIPALSPTYDALVGWSRALLRGEAGGR
ncbi:MAG: DUF2520 domain-containing protein [Deltaproteobacteria bacterium]|jgi:predicted short-subunit dehydrogenase-like oxidoreductase (DUF2520 family)|nr:DUF2520 domain-containing protein [Deltaproteobacteria bacterium]